MSQSLKSGLGGEARVNERLAMLLLTLLALVGLWLAPWAATNRETGARSALILLPNRTVDFTGRTDLVDIPGQGAVLVLSAASLLVVLAGAALRGRTRRWLWLAGGVVLIATHSWGFDRFGAAVREARIGAFVDIVQARIDSPRESADVPGLERVVADAFELPLSSSIAAARAAGLNVRRLPYNNSGMGLSAFLMLVVGGLAVLFSLRLSRRLSRAIDQILATAAVPATSILLALVAAAVVILLLQPTPLGREVEIAGLYPYLVGRLDTLWHAYLTLFADSLGTVSGFMESLKFATPLIFTGLAVAFGFQAGLFNIGAPGQMVVGAVLAMLVGVYLPGPPILVLPLAVVAAAIGGGLWGALPGWLKARFGANEVINTILLNFVAASFLLFILSSNPTFAAPAVRIILLLVLAVVVITILAFVPWVRAQVGRAPRGVFAVVGVVLLVGVILAGLPRAGDQALVLNLPFKVPGSEPKSQEISVASRLPQLPQLFGIDVRENPGTNVVPVNVSLYLALIAALVALFVLPRFSRFRPWAWRLGGVLGVGVVTFGVTAPFGLTAVDIGVPPTKLNASFLLAIVTAVFMQLFLWRTRWGYELRAVGVAPEAAEYGGASIARNTILAMTISGAFAGLTACHYVLGGALEDFSLRQALPTSDGFDGIAVALLGGNAPLGIVLSAFLFGVLKNGGSVLNITFPDLTRDVVSMILALVVLFIAAKGFLPERLINPLRRSRSGEPAVPGRELDRGGETR